MKKVIFIAVLSMMFLLTGCALKGPMPPAGIIFTNVKAPDSSSTLAMRTGNKEDVESLRSGRANATALFGLFAGGDASIEKAMKNGGIKKVHHVDYETTLFFFGLVNSLTTVVYGE